METDILASPPRWFDLLVFRVKDWWWHSIGRRVPRLVWPGDEVDVRITFSEARLRPESGDLEAVLRQLNTGRMAEIEAMLNEIGVEFDRGRGLHGTDWEFDWSLRGPINVRFLGRAKHREKRQPA